jgi:Fic-DOC domain mobile mystery protein B
MSPGGTPLDPDEAEGLIPTHVTTRGELDELEEANIQEGLQWAHRRALGRTTPDDLLTESFVYELHRQMFGAVWEWAGRVRHTDKNIGVDKFQVPTEVRKLIDDARYWRERGVYSDEELALRFHHRLVWIHPFPNGNGRLARLMADLIVQQAGAPAFSWGGASLESTSALRSAYVGALRRADQGDLEPLIAFAHS